MIAAIIWYICATLCALFLTVMVARTDSKRANGGRTQMDKRKIRDLLIISFIPFVNILIPAYFVSVVIRGIGLNIILFIEKMINKWFR